MSKINQVNKVLQEYFEVNKSISSIPGKNSGRKENDEHYLLDLCDEVLKQVGMRQYKFDFLLGDPNAQGNCKKLPVDIYYPELNLVIEYKEQQHTKPNKHFDKPDLFTVSGVNRGKQRKICDQRRLTVLPKHGITVIEISYSDFDYNSRDRILRNEKDLERVRKILNKRTT